MPQEYDVKLWCVRVQSPKLQTLNQGFPATTGTANWPFTKNPLLGFDEGFKNKWKGWEGPEYNVYAKLPPEYPFLEVTHTHTHAPTHICMFNMRETDQCASL
jgi:hypothetical protein